MSLCAVSSRSRASVSRSVGKSFSASSTSASTSYACAQRIAISSPLDARRSSASARTVDSSSYSPVAAFERRSDASASWRSPSATSIPSGRMPRRSPRSRIEAAVDGANEPAITAARRWSRRTGSGSRPRLQSIAARRLRWRAGTDASMSGSAAVSTTFASSWSSSWCGASTRRAAAASSIASGMPSRRRQMVPTSARLAGVVSRSGADRERPLEEQLRGRVVAHGVSGSCSPSAGTGSGSSHSTCSRGTRSVSRLVTTTGDRASVPGGRRAPGRRHARARRCRGRGGRAPGPARR